MTVNESKLKKGKLTFGPQDTPVMDVSCQATNVTLTPEPGDTGDPLEVLCGDQLAGDSTATAWTMNMTAIQDFEAAEGKSFVLWALANDGKTFPYTWQPSETSGTFSGTVTVRAVEIGGDVGARLTSETEWPMNGAPVFTPKASPETTKSDTTTASK